MDGNSLAASGISSARLALLLAPSPLGMDRKSKPPRSPPWMFVRRSSRGPYTCMLVSCYSFFRLLVMGVNEYDKVARRSGKHRKGRRHGRNILFGSPIAGSSCLFCSGSADTVTARAKAAAKVLIKCMIASSYFVNIRQEKSSLVRRQSNTFGEEKWIRKTTEELQHALLCGLFVSWYRLRHGGEVDLLLCVFRDWAVDHRRSFF